MLGVGGKYRVEGEVVEVSMLRRSVVVKVDEVIDVEVSADVAYILCEIMQREGEEKMGEVGLWKGKQEADSATPSPASELPHPPPGRSTWPPGQRGGWILQRGCPFWPARTSAHPPAALPHQ